MAETWSTARQVLVISEQADTFATDRTAIAVGAKQTYLHRAGLTAGYIPTGNAIWAICVPINPEYSDIVARLFCLDRGDTDLQCICTTDTSVVYCRTIGVDNNGPVILEFPKYYNDPTIPPDFDIVFRIYSSAELDWNSFVVTITTSSNRNSTYGLSEATIINITDSISEVRITPGGIIAVLGDTVNVKVYVKDIYDRDISTNW